MTLVNFMEDNPSFAKGQVGNHGGKAKQAVQKQWNNLALTLNSVGVGGNKTGSKWREYWNEKKYIVRKKAAVLRKHQQGTGGGTPRQGRLTDLEERILNLISRGSILGVPEVRNPLTLDEQEPQIEPALSPSSVEVKVESVSETSQSTEEADAEDDLIVAPTEVGTSAAAEATRRRHRVRSRPPPSWRAWAAGAAELEERRLAVEERMAQAQAELAAQTAAVNVHLESISGTLRSIQESLTSVLNRDFP